MRRREFLVAAILPLLPVDFPVEELTGKTVGADELDELIREAIESSSSYVSSSGCTAKQYLAGIERA